MLATNPQASPSFWCDVCGARFGCRTLHESSPRHTRALDLAARHPEPPLRRLDGPHGIRIDLADLTDTPIPVGRARR